MKVCNALQKSWVILQCLSRKLLYEYLSNYRIPGNFFVESRPFSWKHAVLLWNHAGVHYDAADNDVAHKCPFFHALAALYFLVSVFCVQPIWEIIIHFTTMWCIQASGISCVLSPSCRLSWASAMFFSLVG